MLNAFFQIPTYILFVIIFCLIIFANWSGYRYKKWQIKNSRAGAGEYGLYSKIIEQAKQP